MYGALYLAVFSPEYKGGFHGACWCVGGRSVIAIKQGTESEGRWIIDLFHEVRHAAENPADSDSSWIEEFGEAERAMIRMRKRKRQILLSMSF